MNGTYLYDCFKPMLPISYFDESILRRKGETVTRFDVELARLAEAMIATMHEAEGIGLAAQQVGRAIQLCVVDLRASDAECNWEYNGARPPKELFMPLIVVNPKILVDEGAVQTPFEEGCLSFPGIRGEVIRHDKIIVHFQDERGNKHIIKCDGLLARCFQHEYDHLQGILFIDRMPRKARELIDPEIKALVKQTRDSQKKTP